MARSPLRRIRLWTWETYVWFQGLRFSNPHVHRILQGISLMLLFFAILFGVWLALQGGVDVENSVQRRINLFNRQ